MEYLVELRWWDFIRIIVNVHLPLSSPVLVVRLMLRDVLSQVLFAGLEMLTAYTASAGRWRDYKRV